MEKFIEKRTDYELNYGTLTLFETNCPCKDIKFFFEESVLTLMLSGHKTITTEKMTIEFFPGTFFIPEKKCVQSLVIPNASFDNPTKCLVLNINNSFMSEFYNDLILNNSIKDAALHLDEKEPIDYYMSNNSALIKNMIRLYETVKSEKNKISNAICDLYIKELLLSLIHI